jgi:2,5-diketo-D-gluconate reductase A
MKTEDNVMEYLTLHNGVQMPLVGFGTFMLSEKTCTEAVALAIESGYRMIDTAEAYGNEKEVGEGMKKSGIDRKELFLVTKVNFKSYENAEQTVMQSLANLQTDYIDLLLLHWPFANYYAAWRVLEKLYAEGKVRAIGVSNFEPDQLLDLIAYNQVIPAVNQIETNLYCQRSAERIWMDKKQVAHMAYAPLGQGNRNEMFAESAVLALAEKYGKTPAQILLRFLTQKGIVVIPKSTKPAHIKENFTLFDFTLSADEMGLLSALDKKEPLIGKPETPELVEFSLTW